MVNLTDYNDFLMTLLTSLFMFTGGLLILGGIFYLFRKRIAFQFIPEKELSVQQIAQPKKAKTITLKASSLKKISLTLFVIIIGAFLFNQFLMWRTNSFSFLDKLLNINITINKK